MDKILICTTNKELERVLTNELANDFFISTSYIDQYNFYSVVNYNKPDIIICASENDDYLLLSKLVSIGKLIIHIKSSNIDLSGLTNLNNFYSFDNTQLNNILEYIKIINKDYKIIKSLENRIEKYKEKEEEARLVKKAKLKLIENGMTEDEAYSFIIKYSMEKRITKKETSLKILDN